MNSPLDPPEDRGVRVAAQAMTVTAEDLRVRLVLAADLDKHMQIEAGAVEAVGQAVLQILLAARAEADRTGCAFEIVNPSSAFAARVRACRMAEPLGIAH